MRKGLVQLYSGDGKGKTTAAFGLGLRAWGRNQKVLVIQFMKGGAVSGEVLAVRDLEGFQVFRTGADHFVKKGGESQEDRLEATKGLQRAREAFHEEKWDLIILDEINIAVSFGLISEEQVLDLVKGKPERVELILTGRDAPPSLLAASDLVTEMKSVKHPFDDNVPFREGIES